MQWDQRAGTWAFNEQKNGKLTIGQPKPPRHHWNTNRIYRCTTSTERRFIGSYWASKTQAARFTFCLSFKQLFYLEDRRGWKDVYLRSKLFRQARLGPESSTFLSGCYPWDHQWMIPSVKERRWRKRSSLTWHKSFDATCTMLFSDRRGGGGKTYN